MIDPETYRVIKEHFQKVGSLSYAERTDYLDRNCTDANVREMVERLLTAEAESEGFIETPAVAFAEEMFTENWVERRIGKYHIDAELGRGGMGIVFLASRADDEFRQKVALKVVQSAMNIKEVRKRFRQERQILAELEHPNIGRLLDGGTTDDGLPFFVMEYIEGSPITNYCRDKGLGLKAKLEIFRQVCSAVEFAHRHLVIHRDIKPSNVLVTSDGSPKLLDFGIAKLISNNKNQTETITKFRAMTPDYASPEQLRGEHVSTSSDIYSLGIVLNELLGGKSNRTAGDLQNDLRAIVETATRDEVSLRYASVERMSEDVRRYLEGLPVSARPNSLHYRASKFVKRRRLAVAVSAAAIILLAVGVLAIFRQANIAAAERDRAQTALAKAQRISEFLQQALGSANPLQDGREVKIVDVLDKAAKRAETELATDPDVLAEVQRTIGVTYYNLEIYDKAEPLLRSAVGTFARTYGEHDMRTVAAQKELGDLLSFNGNVDEAISLLANAVTALEKDPEKLRESLNARYSLSQAYYFKGENAEAEAGYREILAIADRNAMQHEMIVADVSHELANLIRDTDDQAALELYERSANIVRPLPEKRLNLGTCLSNLGMVLSEIGRHDEAEKFLNESLLIRKESFGEESPAVAVVLTNLSRIDLHRSNIKRAEQKARQAISILEKTLPPSHRNFGPAYVALGHILLNKGTLVEAQTYLEKGLENLKSKQEVRRIGVSESLLGECLALQNRRSDALVLLTRSYEKLREYLGETHPRTIEARERLLRVKK